MLIGMRRMLSKCNNFCRSLAAPRVAAVTADRRGPGGGLAPTPVAIAAIQADRAGNAIAAAGLTSAASTPPTGRHPSLDSLKFPLYPSLDSSSPSMVPRASYESGFRTPDPSNFRTNTAGSGSAHGDLDETTSSGSNDNSENAPLNMTGLPRGGPSALRPSLGAQRPPLTLPPPPVPPVAPSGAGGEEATNNSLLNAAMEAVNNYSDAR